MIRYWIGFLFVFSLVFGQERASSYPYLSGDTWRFFCNWRLSSEESFDPSKVKKGDTIFVEYGSLHRFLRKILPDIRKEFILITPNCEKGSDNPLPGAYVSILHNKKVVAWFLQNIDCKASERIIPIPIGLANRIWPHGDIAVLDRALAQSQPRSIFAYVNFSVSTNPAVRAPCFEYFSQMPWVTVAPVKSFADYLDDLARTVFVISPPGNGLDCHRTWEALLMGCYPVVKSSPLDALFKDLPVVIVKEWEEVTEPFLREKMAEFQSLNWPREKLFADYWFEKVKSIQVRIKRSLKNPG